MLFGRSDTMGHFCLQKVIFKNKDEYETSSIWEIFNNIQEIGDGNSSIAYKAINSNGAYVVIKELLPKKYRNRRSFTRLPTGCAIINAPNFENEKRQFIKEYFFHQEIQRSNTFTGNDNAVLYAGGATLYIVMSYDGEPLTADSLKDFVIDCTDNSIDWVKIILSELKKYAEEIYDIHINKKCLLLDIKTGNLILTKKGFQISYRRMIDYGSFQKIEDLQNNRENEISSNDLAPPEVINKQYSLIDTWSDVFLFANTLLYFLTGNIIDRYLLRQRTAEEFKEIFIKEYDTFRILRNKSKHFWIMLHNFFDYTLSDDIMQNEPTADEVKVLMNETRERTVKKRVRSMKTVIYMLALLTGDSLYPELQEQSMRSKIGKDLKKFREEYYGMPTERKNEYLFSENLFPVFQKGNEYLTTKELMEQFFTKSGAYYISGQSGAGKTTVMKYIACQAEKISNQKVPIPIYVRMTELVFFVKDETKKSIYQYFAEKLFGKPANADIGKIYIEELQKYFDGTSHRTRMLIFFDGVNEIGHYARAKEIISECQNIAQRNNVTAVFSGHDQKVEHPYFKGIILSLRECTEQQISGYLNNLTEKGFLFWQPQNLPESIVKRTLRSLRTPMLAHCFAARFFRINPIDGSQLPANEALVIEQYFFSFGTNCPYERIQAIFSEEKIRVVPYADFLITQVAKLCLDMAVKKSQNVSEREILSAIENGLGTFNNNDGSVTRRIGAQNISNDDYQKMVAINEKGNASWLSFFFTSCTKGYFELIHSSLGFYLAARYLCGCIKSAETRNINSFPECIWITLPEELLRMTAMLMSYEDMKTFCRKFKKRYGGVFKRFIKGQIINDIIGASDKIVLDSGIVANFGTAGENLKKIITSMDIPKNQKAKLNKGLPNNKIEKTLEKAFSRISDNKLSEEEKAKLGSAAHEISRDPQALYLARWLWEIQNDISFKNKISVFISACKQIEKMTSDFLELHQFSGNQASDILGILIAYQVLFPQEYTKVQLIKKCTESKNIDISADILEKLSDFLEDTEIFKLCPRLINTFGAIQILKIIRDDCKKNQYSQILTKPLSSELIHEVSLVACAEWDFRDRDYYPEKIYVSFSSKKHDVYKEITEEKQGRLLLNVREIEISSDISLLIRQFCLVEYEIYSTGNQVTSNTEELFALTQLYTMINYSISKKTGGMVHTHFSLSGNYRIEYDKKINIINNPDILTALIGLEIFDAVPWYGIWKFAFYYIKDFRYATFVHTNPKEYIFFIIFLIILGPVFFYELIIQPLTYTSLLLIFFPLLLLLSAGWGIVYLIWIIFSFHIYKAVNVLSNGLRKLFNR